MSPLLLLLPLLLATANGKTTAVAFVTAAAAAVRDDDGGGGGPSAPLSSPAPPATPPWPEQFHAVVITNLSAHGGGGLQLIDLYYDWPRGRDLNIVRDQLSGEPQWNVEWTNGTAFLFDAASCATFQFAVGLLPPDWKSRGGAAYLGRDRVDGFDCHVWSNFVFARYYEDVATGRPVSWTFNDPLLLLLVVAVLGTREEISPGKAGEPQQSPMSPLVVLLLLLLAAVSHSHAAANAAGAGAPAPVPTPWPEQFHAVVFTNLTESGGRLQLIDLYYDWPRGRNLNLIRDQLSGDPLYDVEWTNGTSYYFDSGSCRTIRFPVGLLPPDWLAAGAVYLGREHVDGFDCHLWTKVDFVWYYEEVATGRPVRWNFFNGMQQHVMSFEVGGVLEDSKWQAPAYCFNGGNADATNVAADGVHSAAGRVDVMNSMIRFAGAPSAAVGASFDQ